MNWSNTRFCLYLNKCSKYLKKCSPDNAEKGIKIVVGFSHNLLFLASEYSLVTSEFAAATVLITYGAVLGKVSRLQLLVIGILEVVFYAINELIAIEFLKYSDAGGSIIIHSFGAYFGLALSRMLHDKKVLDSPKEASVYHSDLFAMIGKYL